MQRLITRQVIDQKGARYIIDILWRLMETEVEEVKVLQTVILLLTTNTVVQGETLSKVRNRFTFQKEKNYFFIYYSGHCCLLSLTLYKRLNNN